MPLLKDILATRFLPLLLDGATGTELEKRGVNVNDPLWSGLAVVENPEKVQAVHYDYLSSGSDLVLTATYQLSDSHLIERGIQNPNEIYDKAVELCDLARQEYVKKSSKRSIYPMIIGSIGPYGAGMADGSEYTGDYKSATDADIVEFHKGRFYFLLQNEKVDVLGFETIPSFQEVKCLMKMLTDDHTRSEKCFYFSFSIKGEDKLADGTLISEVVKYLDSLPVELTNRLICIGANCFPLGNSLHVVKKFNKALKEYGQNQLKHVKLVIYPNSGEVYDGISKKWRWDFEASPHSHEDHYDNHEIFAKFAQSWIEEGNIGMIGGCCRTGPKDIKELSKLTK